MFNKSIVFSLVGLALSLVNVSAMADTPADCTLKLLAALPIERMPDGAIAVPIKVAGADERFLLGFNYPISEIVGDVAEALDLRATGLGKKVYAAKTFEIGNVKGENTIFYTLRADEDAHGAAGILGIDLLSRFDVELDLKHNKLNLFSQDHCPGQGVYWAASAAAVPFEWVPPFSHVVLHAELDGKPISIGMPGAAQFHTVTTTAVLSKSFGIQPNSPDLKLVAGSSSQVFRYPFKSLTIGGVAMSNPAIDIKRADEDLLCGDDWSRSSMYGCYGAAQMQIGWDKLEMFRLYFSFREHLLYITAADAHK